MRQCNDVIMFTKKIRGRQMTKFIFNQKLCYTYYENTYICWTDFNDEFQPRHFGIDGERILFRKTAMLNMVTQCATYSSVFSICRNQFGLQNGRSRIQNCRYRKLLLALFAPHSDITRKRYDTGDNIIMIMKLDILSISSKELSLSALSQHFVQVSAAARRPEACLHSNISYHISHFGASFGWPMQKSHIDQIHQSYCINEEAESLRLETKMKTILISWEITNINETVQRCYHVYKEKLEGK
ncbi:Hypothetical_protein [Hexamita inflata]|uniref:Hypothetical_protein n=1 Tax=Hexamita inflata TaxID=28002 RepID=A0AA86Q2N9_9EUKA|nr:Hypothetical protein HINF_LOCUS33055 [Hexamita inflata]